ncbi:MAG TPA: hypothetical protein VF009_07995 [Solirubrobacterales bacterium]
MPTDGERRKLKREQARRAPMRARILELYEQDRGRSLAPDDLIDELTENFGVRITKAQVAYHLRWLREAELIPAEEDR